MRDNNNQKNKKKLAIDERGGDDSVWLDSDSDKF